jgi:transposase-like protein
VTSDDHQGLKATIARHYQSASWQCGQVLFARNLLGMVEAKHRGRARRGSARHRRGGSPRQLLGLRSAPAPRPTGQPPAGRHQAGGRDRRLTGLLAFPAVHRSRVRTTKGLERPNQELRRRTRVVLIFLIERDRCGLSRPWRWDRARSGAVADATSEWTRYRRSGHASSRRYRSTAPSTEPAALGGLSQNSGDWSRIAAPPARFSANGPAG